MVASPTALDGIQVPISERRAVLPVYCSCGNFMLTDEIDNAMCCECSGKGN